MRNKFVEKINSKPIYGDYGEVTDYIDSVIFSFYANVQPYSSTFAERDYGVIEKVTNRMFCDHIQLKNGDVVKANNIKYKVVSVLEYSRHFEVLLDVIDE